MPDRKPLQRSRGAALTATFFTAISLSREAAGCVCRVLAFVGAPLGLTVHRIASDATDLVALPLIGAAVAWGLRAGAAEGKQG